MKNEEKILKEGLGKASEKGIICLESQILRGCSCFLAEINGRFLYAIIGQCFFHP